MQQQPGRAPAIESAPSAGSASLAYGMDTNAVMDSVGVAFGSQSPSGDRGNKGQRAREEFPKRDLQKPSRDHSLYSSGEMSAEQYYAHAHGHYDQYQERESVLSTVNEHHDRDATPTVHQMHRMLLYLLSHPKLFSEAMNWQSKVDRGVDPSRPDQGEGEEGNGMKSFENEFEEHSRNTAADEHKDEVVTEDGNNGEQTDSANVNNASSKFKDQGKLIPPLPLQIFAPDAEVVLPQALTASQLFGIERVTGIELEAAAGVIGLSQLFLRWLALMPEGDHTNVVDPPGLTVMRISGGRYRVTGAHRVVWRWMNKFSPASAFATPSIVGPAEGVEGDAGAPDTDFDFGDLVTMNIVDVFETDSDGRLLSYCPTFDNRAVHRTQEVTERLRKGASQLKERMEVVARSPAGKSVNKAAGNLGKMGLSAALAVGNIVKSRIEEEIHRHQHSEQQGGGGGGGDVVEVDRVVVERPVAALGGSSGASRGEGYFSDESSGSPTSPRQMAL